MTTMVVRQEDESIHHKMATMVVRQEDESIHHKMTTMVVRQSVEHGFSVGMDDVNLEGRLDMHNLTSSHAHEMATNVVSGQSIEAPCVDGLTLNLLDPQGTQEDSIDTMAQSIEIG
jgi:hypothetical protein